MDSDFTPRTTDFFFVDNRTQIFLLPFYADHTLLSVLHNSDYFPNDYLLSLARSVFLISFPTGRSRTATNHSLTPLILIHTSTALNSAHLRPYNQLVHTLHTAPLSGCYVNILIQHHRPDRPNPFRDAFEWPATVPLTLGTRFPPELSRFGRFLQQMASTRDSVRRRRRRRCYGFILFRFPCSLSSTAACLMLLCVRVCCSTYQFSFSLDQLLGNMYVGCCSPPQLCSISQILEDNIPSCALDHFSTLDDYWKNFTHTLLFLLSFCLSVSLPLTRADAR